MEINDNTDNDNHNQADDQAFVDVDMFLAEEGAIASAITNDDNVTESSNLNVEEKLRLMYGTSTSGVYDAPTLPIFPSEFEERATGPAYHADYWPRSVLDDVLTGKTKMPAFPGNVGKIGDRVTPADAKNGEGKHKAFNREDYPWAFRVRVVYRYKELKRYVDETAVADLRAFDKRVSWPSMFIMAHLREWQSKGLAKYRSYILNSVRQINKWAEMYDANQGNLRMTMERIRLRRSTSHSDAEEYLVAWFKEERAQNYRVTWADMRMKASEICSTIIQWAGEGEGRHTDITTNKVSDGWLQRVCARHDIVMRQVKRQTTLTPEQRTEKTQPFLDMIRRVLPSVDGVFNMDEIPMSLAGSMGRMKTLTTKDDTEVVVRAQSTDTKRIGTFLPVVATILKDGVWKGVVVATFVIFIGQPSQDRVLSEVYFPGITVLWTKCGVMTSDLMNNHIIPVIRARLNELGVNTCLSIIDAARSHTSELVLEKLWANSMPTVVVPAGMTSFLQWIDVKFASKYRNAHEIFYRDWAQYKKTASQKRRLVSAIIGKCMEKLCDSDFIVDTFKEMGYISEAAFPRGIKNIAPTIVTEEQKIEDKAQLNKRMSDAAIAAAARRAPMEISPPKKLGRPKAEVQKAAVSVFALLKAKADQQSTQQAATQQPEHPIATQPAVVPPSAATEESDDFNVAADGPVKAVDPFAPVVFNLSDDDDDCAPI